MTTIKIPTDDPLKIVRAIREKIHEETKEMSNEEFSQRLRKHADSFEKKLSIAKVVGKKTKG